MNEELKTIAIKAGAPEEVLNTLWFSIFCQRFAHLLIEEIEECEKE
jgi:hypothetical protein